MALIHTDRGDTQAANASPAAASLDSASFTPAVNALITVCIGSGLVDGGAGTGSFTMSTTGWTTGSWTIAEEHFINDGGTFSLKSYIAWAVVATAPSAGVVRATRSGGGAADGTYVMQVDEWTGQAASPIGLHGSADDARASGSTLTVGFGGTPVSTSGAVGIIADNNGSTAGAVQPTGWTETSDRGDAGSGTSYDAAFILTGAAASPQWTSLQSSTFGKTGSVLEILAGAPNVAQSRDRDRRAVREIGSRDRWASRDRGRQQRSQFDLYRSTSVAAASADVSVAGLLPLTADLWAPISHDVPVAGILPVGATPIATVSHAANVAGLLPAAAAPLSTVSHDAALVGLLPAAAAPIGTISHDATLAGLLPAAVAPVGTITHAATVAGILPVGAVPLATFTHDATVAGLLFVGAVPLATVSHDASIAGLLPVAAVPYGPVSHTATVAGLLPLGAIFLSQLAGDLSTIGVLYAGLEAHGLVSHAATVAGILYVGAVPASPVTHDAALSGLMPAAALPYATVSRTTSVAGVLPVGLTAIGTVTHQVALVGLLPVGGVLYALVTAAGPDAPDLHPILWIYREAGPLHFTESGLLYVEAAALEATEGPRLTGRDLWITYRETP